MCQIRLKLAKRRSSIYVKLTGGRIEKWTTDGGLKLIKSLIEVFSLVELKTEGKCTKTKKEHTHRCTHIYSSAKIVSAKTELTQENAKHRNKTRCIHQQLHRDHIESTIE